MTKSDLIHQLSADTGLSQSQAGKVVNEVFNLIASSLQKGDDVRITGFGTFRVSETKERTGRNPRTGTPITIPAGKRVVFAPGSGLSETVKGEDQNKAA
jgi:nucleoid DNA-binding protein